MMLPRVNVGGYTEAILFSQRTFANTRGHMFRGALLRAVRRLPVVILLLWTTLILLHFPYDTDRPGKAGPAPAEQVKFYNEAPTVPGASNYESVFDATHERVKKIVGQFVEVNHLQNKRVLEVGSGTGWLQDMVDDYTGLDIAAEDRRHYHKRFVVGSATELPFGKNEFDGAWTIYTSEHVINPETSLAEMRRVVKDGGLLFLFPAWNCTSWAADGYQVRPFSDFGLHGKIIKASLLLRTQPLYQSAYRFPIRFARSLSAKWFGPTRLHYEELRPNFSHYWVEDSDAVNSLDRFETLLWFRSRGDECLNCAADRDFWALEGPLIVRIHKSALL